MTNFIQLLRKSITELTRYPGFLLIAWLVVTLSLPFLYLLFGEQTLLQGLTLSIFLQAAFVLNVLYRSWGWWGMLRVMAAVLLLVWVVQAIIIRSGLPYGDLQYSSALQPQLLGIPFVIPITWLMMLPPAWVVARLITRKLSGCIMRPSFILTSAIAFMGWMISFDPLLARLGILVWTPVGNFYGIPWVNYVFWYFIAALLTFAISPLRLPGSSLLLLYTLVWLVELVILLIFGGLLVPALVGFVMMGGMLLLAALMTR
jgi:uncharacterized membrane protein